MGLVPLAKELGVSRGSTLTKLIFILQNFTAMHVLTFVVAAVSFITIMMGRTIKTSLSKRYPKIAFLPDRFAVVILSAVLTYQFRWDKQGLEILGEVESAEGGLFHFQFPFALSHLNHVKEALSTAFLIAVLGFFESVVAAKSLGTTLDVSISSNRELIALGTANVLGGCFQALPAFGGYGRSKVNKATGGRTPLSSVVLSACTIICTMFLLPYFYYLPRCVLSAMISVVAVSLLEEAPHDIAFFVRLRALPDLATMTLVFLTTLLWSLSTGIAVGVGISLVQVIRHSTQARIQILKREPGTDNFRAVDESSSPGTSIIADLDPPTPEPATSTIVIKIREALTFANAGAMSQRLWRIDRYGDSHAHPSLPRLKSGVEALVFDIAGMASIDGSGAQELRQTLERYTSRGVKVWFCRVYGGVGGAVWTRMQRAGIVDLIGGPDHMVATTEEAVRAAEVERERAAELGGV